MSLSSEQILGFVSHLTGALKGKVEGNKVDLKKVSFSDIYKESVELAKEIRPHAVHGVFPDGLIAKRHPRESEWEYKWKKENYQQVTRPSWNNAVSELFRIWNKQNYVVSFPNTDQAEYFFKDFPIYGSFQQNFYEPIITEANVRDSNSVLAFRPVGIPTIERNGETVADDTVTVDPVSILFESWQVVDYLEGKHFLGLSSDTVKIKNGSQTMHGLIFELYDEENIYKITQTGKFADFTFEVELFYNHALGVLPAHKLFGKKTYRKDRLINESYFMDAIPNLNLALVTATTNNLVNANIAFPIWVHYESDCEFGGDHIYSPCEHGKVYKYDENREELRETKFNCPSCNGTGKGMDLTPGKKFTHNISRRNNLDQEADPISFPGVTTVAPDTKILEHNEKLVQELIIKAWAFLHSNLEKPNGGTATEKKLENESLFALLTRVANELFRLLDFSYMVMGIMKWGNDFEEPKIIPPTEFGLKSSGELTDEYTMAVQAGLPTFISNEILDSYTKQKFPGNKQGKRILDIAQFVDPYLSKPDNELRADVAVGIVQKWEAVLHNNIYTFIQEELERNENFLEGTNEAIKSVLVNKAKEKADDGRIDIQGEANGI